MARTRKSVDIHKTTTSLSLFFKKEYISCNSCLKKVIMVPPNPDTFILIHLYYIYYTLFKNPSFFNKMPIKRFFGLTAKRVDLLSGANVNHL